MKARDVSVGDRIRVWPEWIVIVISICQEPGFDDEEDGVSFSVTETGDTFHSKLSDEIYVLRAPS